jgi:NAD(P)-dependent dehydrogenase (short-subunit alcohol dehydrogenase family)
MRIVVTGASRGIGAAVCRRLAQDRCKSGGEAGLKIALCASRPSAELDSIDAAMREAGAETLPLTGDLADPAVPPSLIERSRAAFGGLDALVLNAGISPVAPLAELPLDGWERVMNVNLRAVWQMAQAAHPALKAAGGQIVTVGSMSGLHPQPGMGAYSVSKAGLIMLTRLMAQEWAADGLRVNCVSPGMVLTPMTEANYRDEDFRRRREAMCPIPRIGAPDEDIAGVVGFLLSADAGYMTGQNLVADGGLSDSILRVLPRRAG